MWAQMITSYVKPGRDDELATLTAQLKAAEQPGSGLVHATATRDSKDPSRVIMFVVFESEENARARENDPHRQEGLGEARTTMMEIFEGTPEFTDLTVIDDWSS
jgi:heme-degrading monooxygenase HmoA